MKTSTAILLITTVILAFISFMILRSGGSAGAGALALIPLFFVGIAVTALVALATIISVFVGKKPEGKFLTKVNFKSDQTILLIVIIVIIGIILIYTLH